MTEPREYICPECGFPVYNRRVAKCESCKRGLPSELLFTAEEIKALDAEHEKSRKEREARKEKEKAAEKRRRGLDDDGFTTWG